MFQNTGNTKSAALRKIFEKTDSPTLAGVPEGDEAAEGGAGGDSSPADESGSGEGQVEQLQKAPIVEASVEARQTENQEASQPAEQPTESAPQEPASTPEQDPSTTTAQTTTATQQDPSTTTPTAPKTIVHFNIN